jgi:hypothetical protein
LIIASQTPSASPRRCAFHSKESLQPRQLGTNGAGRVCALSAVCALSPRAGIRVDVLGVDCGPQGRVASWAGLGVTVNQSQTV